MKRAWGGAAAAEGSDDGRVAPVVPSSALHQLYARRQTGTATPKSPLHQRPTASLAQPRRDEVPGKIWVGGLSAKTDAGSLEAAFRPHGEVANAKVMYTGHGAERQPRGYGFVTFMMPTSVPLAKHAMDGATLDGATIQVNVVFAGRGDAVALPTGHDDAVATTHGQSRLLSAQEQEQQQHGDSRSPSILQAASDTLSVVMVPEQHVGLVIGKGGATIRQIGAQSGAELSVAQSTSNAGFSTSSPSQRRIDLSGLPHQIKAARALIVKLLAGVGAAAARKSAADPEPTTHDEPRGAETATTVTVAAWIDEPTILDTEWS
jgi:hypothetical protein